MNRLSCSYNEASDAAQRNISAHENKLTEIITRRICLASAFSSHDNVLDGAEIFLNQANRNKTIREVTLTATSSA
jgi:hypothetical protein